MKNLIKKRGVEKMAQYKSRFQLKPLKLAMMAATLGLTGNAMSAEIWGNGDYSFNIDTTVSYGASWRIADRDAQRRYRQWF